MLAADDPLPARPQRVLVAGVTGTGKTTLAHRLSGALGIPHVEIDALYHGPGWTYRESFLEEVAELVETPSWVTEWQYRSARELLAEKADTLIWLDLPLRVTMTRLVIRTVRRRLRREVLWNGNIEGPLWKFFTGGDHIIRWAIRTRGDYADRVPALHARPGAPAIVHLRTAREVERWMAGPLAAAARHGSTLG